MGETALKVLSIGWVGSLLGIIGIGLSIWIYLRSQREPKPMAALESIRLVGGPQQALPPSMLITFEGRPVDRVTKTVFRFWNAGNSTLNGNLIVGTDPIRLEVDANAEFLTFNVLKCSRAVNQVCVVIPENRTQLLVAFDFLDATDGVVIECLHTGRKVMPIVKGVIKGIPRGIAVRGPRIPLAMFPLHPRFPRRIRSIIPAITIIGGLLVTIVALGDFRLSELWPIKLIHALNASTPGDGTDRTFIAIMGILYMIFGLVFFLQMRLPYPKTLILAEPAASKS